MPGFDPDQYLSLAQKPQFNPDQYLAQTGHPQITPDAADKAAQGGKPNAQALSILDPHMGSKMMAGKFSPEEIKRIEAVESQVGTPQGAQQIGAALLPGAASIATEGAGALGRIGMNALLGGTQGAINSSNGPVKGALEGAVVGGAIGSAGEAGSSLASKGADFLMKKAVGLKNNIPGIGNTLANLGIMGTKSGMQEQVANKLAAEEQNLQGLVKDLKGSVNSKEIADAVSNKAQKFTLPSTGEASPFSQAELTKVRDMSGKLSQMGDLSGEDLLALKRQGDYQGYTNSGSPATSTEAELGRAGANAARGALKKMSPDAADSLMKEQALVQAQKGLNKPEPMRKGLPLTSMFGATLGAGLGGAPGAAVGAGAAYAAKSPLVQSALGQALQKAGVPASKSLSNPIINELLTKELTK